jgi:hypothetical protein
MPSIDDQLKERIKRSAPSAVETGELVTRLEARKRRRATVRKAGTTAIVACVLLGTVGGFLVLNRVFRPPTLPVATPSQPIENLGLDYPICRVMEMPITVEGAGGDAYVFTREAAECPKPGEGDRFVAADLNGDGVVDTPPVQLDGCFPPVGCETFAAPDVNADGTSEIAVSNAGADGYGVSLYAIDASNATVQQINVVNPSDVGPFQQPGPLEFAWVDVATHSEGAKCGSSPSGPRLIVYDVEKGTDRADVQSTDLAFSGTSATVIDVSHERVPFSEAPAPKSELCGAPLQGSAANFPESTDASGLDIGIGVPLCNVSTIGADFTGDGRKDTVWVGMPSRGARCPLPGNGEGFVAIDVTGDGSADGSYSGIRYCFVCRAYAAADLDGDGVPEVIVLIQASSTPEFGVYEAIRGNVEPPEGILPVTMSTDAPSLRLSAGDPVTLTTGGDEGYSSAVSCEGSATSQILIQWSSQHPVDGPGSDVRDVYVTKLQFSGETATVVDSQHTTQPTSDPLPFDSLHSSGCGVDWFPPR